MNVVPPPALGPIVGSNHNNKHECGFQALTHTKKAREKVSVFDVKNRMAAPGMHMHIAAVNDGEDVNLRIVPLYYI